MYAAPDDEAHHARSPLSSSLPEGESEKGSLRESHVNYIYRGRFAPSPTGPLHFGSLVAALGSYLDAKHHSGTWLVRIEDLDTPRTVKGAADDILRTLETCGLHWDETVVYQSRRAAAYQAAFEQLRTDNLLYPCACSRKEIADSALHGIDGLIYPGTCRSGIKSPSDETTSHLTNPAKYAGQVIGYPQPSPVKGEGAGAHIAKENAWRVRTDLDLSRHSRVGGNPAIQNAFCSNPLDSHLRGNDEIQNKNGIIEFNDALQGRITQHLESEIGDFVVKRADGLFAYQLAVVVDDAFQGITHVVRGADLLTSTTRQIYLQRLLGFATPAYIHLPIAVNAQGEKLGKQTLAAPVNTNNPAAMLLRALAFLRQEPPVELSGCDPETVLDWALANWDVGKMNGIRTLPAL